LKYEQLVDIYAHRHTVESVFRPKAFYGRLEHLVALTLPPIPRFKLRQSETLFLAAVTLCKIEQENVNGLDMHLYSQDGPLEVIDLDCVQCLVGRVFSRGKWTIFDRSGALGRAFADDQRDRSGEGIRGEEDKE
jgi:hypothetical protein